MINEYKTNIKVNKIDFCITTMLRFGRFDVGGICCIIDNIIKRTGKGGGRYAFILVIRTFIIGLYTSEHSTKNMV